MAQDGSERIWSPPDGSEKEMLLEATEVEALDRLLIPWTATDYFGVAPGLCLKLAYMLSSEPMETYHLRLVPREAWFLRQVVPWELAINSKSGVDLVGVKIRRKLHRLMVEWDLEQQGIAVPQQPPTEKLEDANEDAGGTDQSAGEGTDGDAGADHGAAA